MAPVGPAPEPEQRGLCPGLVVHPTPGDHEYGDANENDRGTNLSMPRILQYFDGLGDLPAGVTEPSNDFYSFDIPVNGGTWHIISLDSECAALPARGRSDALRTQAGCAVGSPEETWLHNDLAAHQGECTLIHWHEPEFPRVSVGTPPTTRRSGTTPTNST